MSHWMRGRMDNLICSLQKMREAIVNIIPEWEKHIQISDDGNLSIQEGGRSLSGFHIKVPQTAPGVHYADLGLKQIENGSWELEYDRDGLPQEISDTPTALKNEINAMRAKEIALKNGITIVEDTKEDITRCQRLRMTSENVQQFLQQM